MKHLAAYLLLTLAGNDKPTAGDVEKVLSSVGIEADSDRLEKLISELEGKDLNEVRDIQFAACVGLLVANTRRSSSLRARPSSPPSPRAAVAAAVLVVPPLAVLPRRPRRRRRRSVSVLSRPMDRWPQY